MKSSKLLIILALCGGLLSQPIIAEEKSKEEIILEAAVRAGAEAYTKEKIKELLNEKIAEATANGVEDFGSDVMFYINMAKSVNDFANAENDHDKLFAGLRAAASYIAYVNPAVGAVVQVVLLAVQLVDGAVSAEHAKELMKIYEDIARIQEQIYEMQIEYQETEFIEIKNHFQNAIGTAIEMQRLSQFMTDNCMLANAFSDEFLITECMGVASLSFYEQRNFISSVRQFLEFKGRFVDVDTFYDVLRQVNEMSDEPVSVISKEDLLALLEANEAQAQSFGAQMNSHLQNLSHIQAQVAIEEAKLKGQMNEAELERLRKLEESWERKNVE